ncbi:LysR family transcriptional regulator [Oceanisphaera marina]|uniref:LysR family transcriptional regulator n=1 Tax=Oceanisphaera marina TaxID=2017550 RepID=A0ABQ1IDU8_9GAMM|nr:LysR family transcriptional regulator [Oceanisphaera marina]GGB32525.1 LysR family transcriptional regulator [Oceanisphaera marina]
MAIPFTFRQLSYFVSVAQHGSISKAADTLHVSQPSVSIAIHQLESLLNQPLFQRHRGQGVSLTPRGEGLFREARQILTLSHNLLASQERDNTQIEGQLVICCFRDIAPYYLPRLVSEFERRYPKIRVVMQEQDLAGVSQALKQGKAELALSYELGLPQEVDTQVLDELKPYALLPAGHKLAEKPALSLAEIAKETLILQDMPLTREYFMSLFWHQDLQPAAIHTTASFEMQRGLVAHGHGVALSCTRPAGDQSYDGAPLACRPLRDELPPQRVVLARSREFPLSIPAQRFLDQVARQPHRRP